MHHVGHSPGRVAIRQRGTHIQTPEPVRRHPSTCARTCGRQVHKWCRAVDDGGKSGDKTKRFGDNPVTSKIPLDLGKRRVHPGVTPSGDAAQRPIGRPGGHTPGPHDGSADVRRFRTVGRSICNRFEGQPEGRERPGGHRVTPGAHRCRATGAGNRSGNSARGVPRVRETGPEGRPDGVVTTARCRATGTERWAEATESCGRTGQPARTDGRGHRGTEPGNRGGARQSG